MDREAFVEEIIKLAEVYDTQLTDAKLEMYFAILKRLSLDEFKQSIAHVLENNIYNKFPLPAHLLEIHKGDPEQQAMLAMEELDKAVRHHGAYQSVTFQDPILGDIVSAHGWIDLCRSTQEDMRWIVKDFVKMYKAKQASGNYSREPVACIGITEQNEGSHIEPVLIGTDRKLLEG